MPDRASSEPFKVVQSLELFMSMPTEGVFQPVDETALRLAKTLLRSARFAALGVIDKATGHPAVSRVNTATTIEGQPVILISELSPHFAALHSSPKASLLLGEPGQGDPLAHPRVTVNGTAHRVTDDAVRARLRSRFLGKHPKSELYVDFADFAFWILQPESCLLNAGFGKAYAPIGRQVLAADACLDELAAIEASAVSHMNDDHLDAIDTYARHAGSQLHGWRLASLDPEGLDLVNGDQCLRIWFDTPLAAASELRATLVSMAQCRQV